MADETGWSEPPWSGWIETTGDALLILEAARRGLIPRVTRRLVDSERKMITSGSVFVFDEHESGIKRWTDGYFWSPSRILGNFLLYRETDKRGAGHRTRPAIPENLRNVEGIKLEAQVLSRPKGEEPGGKKARERTLVGSLTNTVKFKQDGLMKKTFSLTIGGVAQHLISYYKVEDVEQGRLRCPSSLPELACLDISPEYLDKEHFRNPPKVEVGPDGHARYRGEADDTETSPHQVLRKRSASVDEPEGSADRAEGSAGPAKRTKRAELPPPKRGRKKPPSTTATPPQPVATAHPHYPYAVPYYAAAGAYPPMYAAGSIPGTPGTPQPIAALPGQPTASTSTAEAGAAPSADNPADAVSPAAGAAVAYPYPMYTPPAGYTAPVAGDPSQSGQQGAYMQYYAQQYRYAWPGYPGYGVAAAPATSLVGTPPQNGTQAVYTYPPPQPMPTTSASAAPPAVEDSQPGPVPVAAGVAVIGTVAAVATPPLTDAERAAAAIAESMNFGLQNVLEGEDDDAEGEEDGEGEDEIEEP